MTPGSIFHPVQNTSLHRWRAAKFRPMLGTQGLCTLPCHTYCDTGPRFFRSHANDRPIQSPLKTHEGMWRVYSNPNLDTNGKITTQLYDKRDDFNFSIVNIPYLCSNIPASLAYGVYISQLIRYAKANSIYDKFLVRGNLLTDKLRSQGFQLSRLQAAFRKFYGRYNDLICPYNLSLGHMLSDMLHTNR
jgi:hypothetical protein